jgi:ribonuclease HIII
LYKRLYNNASLKSGRKAENNVFEQFAENNQKPNHLKKDTYQSTPISSRVQIDIDEESNSDIFIPQDLNL